MDAPSSLVSTETDALSPAPHAMRCDEDSCSHRWVPPVHPADDPLRVRLPGPGRYEFQVRHVSSHRETRRQFVVVATRD